MVELEWEKLNQANKLWDRRNSHRATEPQSHRAEREKRRSRQSLFLSSSVSAVSLWHNKCPNVAYSDLEMGSKDGFQFLQRAKAPGGWLIWLSSDKPLPDDKAPSSGLMFYADTDHK